MSREIRQFRGYLGLFSVAIVVSLIAFAAYAKPWGYWGGWGRGPCFDQQGETSEFHQDLDEAFKNRDYQAWKKLMEDRRGNPRVLDVVTEKNFDQFAKAHELMHEGKYSEAREIQEELGLRGSGKYHDRRGYRGRHHRGGHWWGHGWSRPCWYDSQDRTDVKTDEIQG